MLRRASFLFVAIVSSLAALAAPLFGPERAISPIIYAPPLGVQQPNGIASDGNGFLAVWDDGATERRGIYAALISPTGEIRPESQILIRRDAGFAFVAWNGESYSVFWNEGSASTLMLARVSRDGHLLDEPRALIDRANVAAVASNGTNVLVAYARDFGGSRDLRALTIDRAGNIVGDVVVAPNAGYPATAASDGDSFVVVSLRFAMDTTAQVIATRLSSRGLWLAQREVLSTTFPQTPAVAYGAGTYELVLRAAGQLQALSFDAATFLPSQPVTLENDGYEPAVVFNGSAFVALWHNSLSVRSAVIEPDAIAISNPIHSQRLNSPLVASNGRNLFAIWLDYAGRESGDGDVFGALLDSRGQTAATAAVPVAFAPATQAQPVMATSGSEAWLVWIERMNDASYGRVMAARIDADGSVGAPRILAEEALVTEPPQLVFTGSAYFAAWVDGSGSHIAGRVLERNGNVGPELAFGTGYWPALASNGTMMLLVFLRPPDVVGIRLNDRGAPIDSTPLTLAAARRAGQFGPPSQFTAASNGSDFLVVWTEGSDWWQFPSPGLRDIYGLRVMSNGAVDAAPIAIAAGQTNQSAPAVASDGRDYAVAYQFIESIFATSQDAHVAAKRVLREGQISDLSGDVDGAVLAEGRVPRAAGDANGYLVAFPSTEGVRVVALDANAAQRWNVLLPMSGAGGAAVLAQGARTLLVYTRLVGEPGIGAAQRAFVRVGSEGSPRIRSARH